MVSLGSCAAAAFVPAVRTPILQVAGHALASDDPIHPSDMIVVTLDAGDAGLLEAADLFHSGIAPRVALFGNEADTADREFLRRVPSHEDGTARARHQLMLLGVDHVEPVPAVVTGTRDEGRVLAEWCDQQRVRSIVVVSSADHSRRLGRVVRRGMNGHGIDVMVRQARFSAFDPDHWWQTRTGMRTEIIESQKLLLDVLSHPWS